MPSLRLCPICQDNSARIQSCGGYAHHAVDEIAGIQVPFARQRFELLRCSNCRFIFKSPQLSQGQLLDLYAKSTDRATDFPIGTAGLVQCKRTNLLAQLTESAALAHTSGRKVLEVGCSNGMMLSRWSDDWEKFGVEPSLASAQIAHQSGVKVLCPSIYDITNGTWDCILSVDTIEHINDPLNFFAHAKNLLSPGGIILTLTGNSSCFLARLAGSRYWYASFPEHISFLSPYCLEYIAHRLNGRMLLNQAYRWSSPGGFDCREWLVQSVKFGVFVAFLAMTKLTSSGSIRINRGSPVMTAHKDHFLGVIGGFG